MGHSSSKEALLQEPPTSRRLSKPPTRTSSFDKPHPKTSKPYGNVNRSNAPLLDESMIWKSPWTGDLLPKTTPEIHNIDRNRVRSFPSFSVLQRGPSSSSIGGNRRSTVDGCPVNSHEGLLSLSDSYVSRRLSKRSSRAQVPSHQSQTRTPLLRDARNRSTFCFATPEIASDAQQSFINDTTMREAATMVASNAPPMRRRSLQRPGIPMRTPQNKLNRRDLLSVEWEDLGARSSAAMPASRSSRWPLYESDEEWEYPRPCSVNGRSISPIALDYSHLGGFKRGSLRIVNRSASPADSDRNRSLATLRDYPMRYPNANDDSMSNVNSSFKELENVPIGNKDKISAGPMSVEQLLGIEKHAHTSQPLNYIHSSGDLSLHNNGFNKHDRNHSGSHNILDSPNVIASTGVNIPERKRDQYASNPDSGYSSLGSVNSDKSSSTSYSPPRSCRRGRPRQRDGKNAARISEHRYALRNESKQTNHYLKQPEKGISAPSAVLSPAFRKNRNRERGCHNDAQRHRKPSGPPRYYANLGPTAIPPVPDRVSVQKWDSDSEASSPETDSIVLTRARRLSTGHFKRVRGRDAYSDSEVTSGSAEFCKARNRRDPSRDSYYRRSSSRPAAKSRPRSHSEPGLESSCHSGKQNHLPKQQAYHDTIPPVPRIPSTFEGHRRPPNPHLNITHNKMESHLPRGYTRSPSEGQDRVKLVKARRLSVHRITNSVQVVNL